MRYLMLVLVLLMLAGCGVGEPVYRVQSVKQEDDTFSPQVWVNMRRVAVFDTYAEARAECDRLNDKERP